MIVILNVILPTTVYIYIYKLHVINVLWLINEISIDALINHTLNNFVNETKFKKATICTCT
jgi:hypothetical protein